MCVELSPDGTAVGGSSCYTLSGVGCGEDCLQITQDKLKAFAPAAMIPVPPDVKETFPRTVRMNAREFWSLGTWSFLGPSR